MTVVKNKVIRKFESFVWGYCRCGCGEIIEDMSGKGARRLIRFKRNHYNKKFPNQGVKCYNWIPERTRFLRKATRRSRIDDKILHEYDYYKTSIPDHPLANTKGMIVNSRLVYEQYLKILFDEDIYIPRKYDVFHINRNEKDNSLVNLVPLTKTQIIKITHTIDMSDRYCYMCLSPHTLTRKHNGRPIWFKYYDLGFICQSCYNKYHRKNKDLNWQARHSVY